jgi:pyruvate dehydrogenase E2 component (dihydrolipoamide acetyltransferase)
MTDVIMPKMGDAMEEGTLVEWLKKEGEKVKSGEVIGTIQTDKAHQKLPSGRLFSQQLREVLLFFHM